MKQFVEKLQHWEFHVCGVFLVDSQFMVESFKVSYGTDSEVLKIETHTPTVDDQRDIFQFVLDGGKIIISLRLEWPFVGIKWVTFNINGAITDLVCDFSFPFPDSFR